MKRRAKLFLKSAAIYVFIEFPVTLISLYFLYLIDLYHQFDLPTPTFRQMIGVACVINCTYTVLKARE